MAEQERSDLTFSLDGKSVKCKIGFGVTIVAADRLRAERKAHFREQCDLFAEFKDQVESQKCLNEVMEDYFKHQVPTEEEVKAWLKTMPGLKFCLTYGTQRFSVKLTDETSQECLDEMSSDDFEKLTTTVLEICDGEEAAKIRRQASQEFLEISRLQLQGLINHKNSIAMGVEEGRMALTDYGDGLILD